MRVKLALVDLTRFLSRSPVPSHPCSSRKYGAIISKVSLSPSTERVLIVDEDPDVLDLLSRQVLEPLGYEVATANEAGIAIQQAVSFSPDLIVASLMLPGLSGKDLLVALRSQGLDVPVIVTAEEG